MNIWNLFFIECIAAKLDALESNVCRFRFLYGSKTSHASSKSNFSGENKTNFYAKFEIILGMNWANEGYIFFALHSYCKLRSLLQVSSPKISYSCSSRRKTHFSGSNVLTLIKYQTSKFFKLFLFISLLFPRFVFYNFPWKYSEVFGDVIAIPIIIRWDL